MNRKKILILGGGGYVGGALVNEFLRSSEPVDVVTFDSYWFSAPPMPFGGYKYNPLNGEEPTEENKTQCLRTVVADIRDSKAIAQEMKGVDVLIHLACISNDPGFDLNPKLGREINYDSLDGIMQSAVENGVERVIYASSSSVYGACNQGSDRDEYDLTNPLTDYAKYKLDSEIQIKLIWDKVIPVTVLRPATLCGWPLEKRFGSIAMRFDLMFNSFVAQAILDGGINVRGGDQKRALLVLSDMVDLYVRLALETDIDRIAGKTWNVGHCNHTIRDLALMIAMWRVTEGNECIIKFAPTDDLRSYAINTTLIEEEYDFVASAGLEDVYKDIRDHIVTDEVEAWNTPEYIRVLKLKELGLA